MFHAVFSGPDASAGLFVDALRVDGFLAQPDRFRGGFPVDASIPELHPDLAWVELVAGSDDWLAQAERIGERFGFVVRLHGTVLPPASLDAGSDGSPSPMALRVAQLEDQVARLLEAAK